ncbi:hypothetical protein U1Q18_050462, partial [Sarracenia purpurea var. burkii]
SSVPYSRKRLTESSIEIQTANLSHVRHPDPAHPAIDVEIFTRMCPPHLRDQFIRSHLCAGVLYGRCVCDFMATKAGRQAPPRTNIEPSACIFPLLRDCGGTRFDDVVSVYDDMVVTDPRRIIFYVKQTACFYGNGIARSSNSEDLLPCLLNVYDSIAAARKLTGGGGGSLANEKEKMPDRTSIESSSRLENDSDADPAPAKSTSSSRSWYNCHGLSSAASLRPKSSISVVSMSSSISRKYLSLVSIRIEGVGENYGTS